MSVAEISSIVVRDIDEVSELHEVEQLQREVWGLSDLDIVPLSHLIAAKAAGGVLLGAFDDQTLVGFVYGFVSYEQNQMAHHSHMLAVRPDYRNLNLGHRLKLEQRERVLAQGITLMSRTFDPLQSLNAYFNFNKLGVLADQYKINFYGEDAASFLHRNGTDRLWVAWLLKSQHVIERLDKGSSRVDLEHVNPLVQLRPDSSPRLNDLNEGLSKDRALIEVPIDINALESSSAELAGEWRQATRRAFTESLRAGYLVVDFMRRNRDGQEVGTYLLSRGESLDDFAG
ncbi:MAG: GNAT family N-acetyltransferase [Pyrinomonadaceae bacterium]